MARDQDSVQAERAGRSHIAPVSLVKLTCYSNRIDGTVAKTFYLANLACEYDYGNTGSDQMFLPVILGGGDFFSGFAHVPGPDDLTSFQQSFDLRLSNYTINGSRLIELLQGYNLEGASIEVAQLLLTKAEMDSYSGLKSLDLTSYDGDEHTVLFRGRVNRVAPINDSFLTIQCTTELPSMAGSWNYATDDTTVDPQDLGKRLPRVYGKAKKVRGVGVQVGWVTTLAEELDATETGNKAFTDLSGISGAGNVIKIGNEEVLVTYVSDTVGNITARAQNSTAGVSHALGEIAIEMITTVKFIVSDRRSDAVQEVYLKHPGTGELIRIPSGYTASVADTTTVPGQTVTTVSFTTAQLRTVLESAFADIGTASDPEVVLLDMIGRISSTVPSLGDPLTNPTGIGGVRRLDGNGVGADTYIMGWWPTGSIPSSGRTIVRWRTRFIANCKNTHVGGTEDTVIHARYNGYDGSPLNGTAAEDIYEEGDENVETYGIYQVGSWHTPDAGTTLADFEGSGYSNEYIILYGAIFGAEDFNAAEWVEWSFCGVEIEVEPAAGEFSGAMVGFGLELYADVDGIEAPAREVLTWTTGEDFDDGTWEVDGCTVAVDTGVKSEGTGSQKITVDVDTLAGSEVISSDALTDWTAPDDATVALDASEGHRLGSYAIKGVSTSDSGYARISFEDAATTIDVTDTGGGVGFLVFDFKIKKNGSTGFIQFFFGNDSTDDYNWKVESSELDEDTWYTIILDWREGTGSGVDETDMDYFSVLFNQATRAVGVEVYIDNIKILREVPPVIQNNAAGGLDFTAPSNDYRISGQPGGVAGEPADVTVYITDDVGSGTGLTTDYRQIEFPASWVDDEFADVQSDSYADTNTPDVSNVNTVRVELTLSLAANTAQSVGSNFLGVHLRDPIFVFYVDDLAFSATLGTAWDVSEDAVLIHPADIMRHWIVEVGGETFDATSYTALITSLGAAAEWGFDARSLGFTWAEVLQRMAFEARTNIVPVEKSTGREWKMLAADNDYGFGSPAASAVITQTHDMSDVGRSVEDIASHFSFRYAFNASLPGGGNEEGFTLALDANPSVSDVPITTALITAAAQRFGAVESGPVAFRCIQLLATAQDVAGFIVQERMANDRRVYELRGVAWFDALPYDVGDIASITAPWSSSATTCRITSMAKAFESNAWTLTAVEVLATGTRTP